MISEFLIDIVFGIVSGLLSVLPEITWEVQMSQFGLFFQLISAVGYLLPMGTITTIFGLVISLTLFRITISLIKTIWDLLPIV